MHKYVKEYLSTINPLTPHNLMAKLIDGKVTTPTMFYVKYRCVTCKEKVIHTNSVSVFKCAELLEHLADQGVLKWVGGIKGSVQAVFEVVKNEK